MIQKKKYSFGNFLNARGLVALMVGLLFAVAAITVIAQLNTAFNVTNSSGASLLYVRDDGNVGIGTTSPAYLLHIVQSGTNEAVRIHHSGVPAADKRVLDVRYIGSGRTGSGNEILFVHSSVDADTQPLLKVLYDGTGIPPIAVFQGGNVGIGTTAPGALLHISSSAASTDLKLQNTAVNAYSEINFTNDARTYRVIAPNGGDSDKFQIYDSTAGLYRLTIDTFGNIGIGTTSPTDKLEVSGGNIRVTGGSFIDDGTTLNAPDYVFEAGYPLMSLDELQAYLAQNKRLPNIPSAEEIRQNGLNLSQFQMKLLEKIEEMTLYALAQEEKIKSQQEQIKIQQAELNELKSKMARFESALQKLESLTVIQATDEGRK